MSKVTIAGDVNGTGVFTIAAPNGNTNRTLTLPDEAGTLLTSVSDLVAANLTGVLPAIDGSALTGIAGGVTSLNGQTGAITNTSLGTIGSYYFPYNAISLASIGSTTAGSNLTFRNQSGGAVSNAGLSGTWRHLGAEINSASALRGLYVRIS